MTRSRMVGREVELAALGGYLVEALEGMPRVAVCVGEPGIGKTRLAEELVSIARGCGAVAAWGKGVEDEGAPPFWPWHQVLRGIADRVDVAAVGEELGVTAALSRIAPDVVGVRAGDGAAAGLEDRFRLFDGIARLIGAITRRTALVIVLDDAQWADQPSLLLLRHLSRVLTNERLLVVVTQREAAQPTAGPLVDLRRELVVRSVPLVGLGRAAIREHLTAGLGEVGDDEVAEVEAVTGGNPFFIVEMTRMIGDRRAGRRRSSTVTPSLRDAIGVRLQRLPPETIGLLQLAALAGWAFSVTLVAAAVGQSRGEALAALDVAAAAGFVEADRGADEYRFVHALVRDAVEAGLATPDRIRGHRALARAIESRRSTPGGRDLFDLARHWAVAAIDGDEAHAARWIERAADEAMRRFAFEEAARLYRRALQVAADALEDGDRIRLLLGAGGAADRAGEFGTCLDVTLEAAALARSIGRSDLVAESALVPSVVGLAGVDITVRRLCSEAAAFLDPDAVALRARVLARYTQTFLFDGSAEAAERSSREALTLAERSNDPEALAAALRARLVVCTGPEGLDERERMAARLLDLGRGTDDPRLAMDAAGLRIDVALERGDLAGTAGAIDELARWARVVGGPAARYDEIRSRAVLALAQGRYADARRLHDEAFAILGPAGHQGALHVRQGLVPTIASHVGHDEDSLDAAAMPGVPRDGRNLIESIAEAHALVTAGRSARAAEILRSLGPAARWAPPPHVVLCSTALGIGVTVALDFSADVEALRDRLEPYRGHHVVSGAGAVTYMGPVEIWLGVAAHHLGRLDAAVDDLEDAAAACAANGAAGFGVEATYELAAALADRGAPGDREHALLLIAGASETAAALRASALASKIDKLRARIDAAAPLTHREREIGALVASGMTNKQIAQRLYLSPRTVENHVQHILTKLDLTSRGQIPARITLT